MAHRERVDGKALHEQALQLQKECVPGGRLPDDFIEQNWHLGLRIIAKNRDPELVFEAVGNVILKLDKVLLSWKANAKWSSWLCAVARNAYNDAAAANPAATSFQATEQDKNEDEWLSKQQLARGARDDRVYDDTEVLLNGLFVHQMVDRLTDPTCRAVCKLLLQGLKLKEVARHLKIVYAKAWAAANRAYAEMKELCEGRSETPRKTPTLAGRKKPAAKAKSSPSRNVLSPRRV